jgi:hypothetical protein
MVTCDDRQRHKVRQLETVTVGNDKNMTQGSEMTALTLRKFEFGVSGWFVNRWMDLPHWPQIRDLAFGELLANGAFR